MGARLNARLETLDIDDVFFETRSSLDCSQIVQRGKPGGHNHGISFAQIDVKKCKELQNSAELFHLDQPLKMTG